MMKKIVLFVLSALLLVACSGMDKREESIKTEVMGKTYELEGVIEGSSIDITFDENQVAGSAGVNRYFAPYLIEGNNLSIKVVGTTRMMGPEELMTQESEYIKNLEKAEKIEMVGEQLVITSEGGRKLVFNEKVRSFEEVVADKTFKLEGALPEHDITITFGEGRLAGNAGVNNYSAAYEVEDGRISVSPQIITTMMAGPEEAMDQESQYLKDLATAEKVEAEDEGVVITLKDGRQLIFK
jgi:heat shock protein HslJ